MAQQNKDTNELIKVRRQKLSDLQEAGKNPFEITKYDVTHHSVEIKDNYDELEGKEVSVAGRLMFKRVMGKASFCNVQDLQGSIQAYVARDEIGVEEYKDFRKWISEISWESRELSLQQRQEKNLSMRQKFSYYPRAFVRFLRSSMA